MMNSYSSINSANHYPVSQQSPKGGKPVPSGGKVFPTITQLGQRETDALARLVTQKRCVLDSSVFRLHNIPLIDAFFSCLMSLLLQYSQQVIVVEETARELEHLASRPQVSDAVRLATAGLGWFQRLQQYGLLQIEHCLSFSDNRSDYVHPSVAILIRLSQAMLLNREGNSKPFALITSNRDVADDLSKLMTLNTVMTGVSHGKVCRPEIHYVNVYGYVSSYICRDASVTAQPPAVPAIPAMMPAAAYPTTPPMAAYPTTPPVAAYPTTPPMRPATPPARPATPPVAARPATPPARPAVQPKAVPIRPAPAPSTFAARGKVTDIPVELVRLTRPQEGMELKDSSGEQITLSTYIDGQAEGFVYEVKDRPHQVAKVFEKLTRRKMEKIQRMCGIRISGVTMPESVLYNSSNQVCGYLMPKVVDGLALTEFFDERSRSRFAPEWDRESFVQAALHLTQIGSELARRGILPTDGNLENIMVCRDADGYYSGARVVLIDVDAFQVDTKQIGGTDVGIIPGDGFSADILPIMDGMTAQTVFSEADYAYMLAIQTFMLCMGGLHPFQAKPDLRYPDRSLTQLSRQGLFPYGTAAIPATMAQPLAQGKTLFELMMPEAQKLYAEYFSVNSPRREASARPTIGEQRRALAGYARWIVSGSTDPHARELKPSTTRRKANAA